MAGAAAPGAAAYTSGSTAGEHRRFGVAGQGGGPGEGTLEDGLAAGVRGLAAQESAGTGQVIDLRGGAYALA